MTTYESSANFEAGPSSANFLPHLNPVLPEKGYNVSEIGSARDAKEVVIRIPNIYPAFFPAKVTQNPYYSAEGRAKLDEWVSKILNYDEATKEDMVKANFGQIPAYFAPYAEESKHWTSVLWVYWEFVFDDRFDEGDLQKDVIAATKEVLGTLAIFEDDHPEISAEQDPVKHMFQKVWIHLKETSSLVLQKRYKEAIREYMLGLLKQVYYTSNTSNTDGTSIEDHIDLRRGTAGGQNASIIAEWASGIQLPEDVAKCQIIRDSQELVSDIIGLQNDVLSIKRDLSYSFKSNPIVKLCHQGYSLQAAVDEVGRALDDCYNRWDLNVQKLETMGWDSIVMAEVKRLLELHCFVCLGIVEWSFETGRYGLDRTDVCERGIIRIPAELAKAFMKRGDRL
ncbi:hypothetical protein TWF481_000495 [Arthrobotrys musiformis]|uniref:Terpene synthase n=1 Tax=Arthrobotrys musiformis TaxID=47236 RepID=A0AAV9WQ10_9PEZI